MLFRRHCGDYSSNNLHCGDRVYDKADPRHVGILLSIQWGTAKVRWDETGWISEVLTRQLRKESENVNLCDTIRRQDRR